MKRTIDIVTTSINHKPTTESVSDYIVDEVKETLFEKVMKGLWKFIKIFWQQAAITARELEVDRQIEIKRSRDEYDEWFYYYR